MLGRTFAVFLFSGALALPAAAQGEKPNAGKFDGRWSVLVVTEKGPCDQAYRWNLGVAGGRITDLEDNVASASGSIASSGRVNVRLVRGQDVLTAVGSIQQGAGRGTWQSPSRQCSGRWEAEKR